MASENHDEHVWRFELKPLSDSAAETDLVVGFVRTALRELLDFVVLTHDEQEAKVDGFKLQGKPGANHAIFDKG